MKLLDVFLNRFRQRHIASLISLNNLSALLGNDNYMIVFLKWNHDKNKKVKYKSRGQTMSSVVFYASLVLFRILHIHTAINLNHLSADIA